MRNITINKRCTGLSNVEFIKFKEYIIDRFSGQDKIVFRQNSDFIELNWPTMTANSASINDFIEIVDEILTNCGHYIDDIVNLIVLAVNRWPKPYTKELVTIIVNYYFDVNGTCVAADNITNEIIDHNMPVCDAVMTSDELLEYKRIYRFITNTCVDVIAIGMASSLFRTRCEINRIYCLELMKNFTYNRLILPEKRIQL